MPTSVPFCVTGLSGKTLIQSLPPFCKNRIEALRAASICRDEIHFASCDCKPNAPKANEVALLSFPTFRLLPLCHFLCFTFLGINIYYSCFLSSFSLNTSPLYIHTFAPI